MKFDYCVFIGRFSAFHLGHLAILEEALKIGKEVIVAIGSAASSRNIKNPWTANERQAMIESSLKEEDLKRVKFIHLKDYLYMNNMWLSVTQEKIATATNHSESVALIGFESDETSFYLSLFPQYKYIEHGTKYKFHATQIRDYYFTHDAVYKKMVPVGVVKFLEEFKTTEHFKKLHAENEYINNYKESWRGAPFPVIFQTVDSIVLKSGHILLVERGHNPGKGLLAMPGGFVNIRETLATAALRELKEETGIKVNIPELRKSIVDQRVFDDPNRSSRGRTLSTCFLIDLGTGPLPQIEAGDDAAKCMWLPLSEFYMLEDKFFEDHFHILRAMVAKR